MNPITNIRNQNKINEKELQLGIAGDLSKSWHQKYAESAWIYVGGLPYDLTEGDIIAVFSQYGEIVNINLIRDRKTGKSKGFAFVCYENQKSTVMAVDNLNGIKLVGRMIRVDHVEEYKIPKYKEEVDEEIRRIWEEGCAPKPIAVDESLFENDSSEEEEKIIKSKLDPDGLIPFKVEEIDEELKTKIKEEGKKAKKRMKREKKEKKREKKEKKREKREKESGAPQTKGGKFSLSNEKRDLNRSWKEQRKGVIDKTKFEDDDEFYGSNSNFNFNKERKELPPAPTHNLRPDFEKADWRDIEMWKIQRDRDKAAKGEEKSNWKEEEHYLPSRFHR